MNQKQSLPKLNRLMHRCQNVPFYRERLPRLPLKSLAEFNQIPLTTKEDLRKHSPFGLLAVPQTKLYQYHESFGTTGTPVSVWLTRKDYQVNAAELMGWGVNFQPGDTVMVRFPYSISAIAHTVTTAAQRLGACVIPAGSRSTVSPFSRIVQLLRKLKVTVLTCLPLQALLIAETAQLMGFDPRADFPELRAICTAGELLTPGRRQIIEDVWGVSVFDNYGMTEIGAAVVDCQWQHSHPLTDYFYFEILREDLKTPAESGETGLLVITTLQREGTPLVRYLTGDRARMVNEPCPCGAHLRLEVRGRAEHLLTIGDHSLDLWDLEELVAQLPHRRFWIAAPVENTLHLVVEEEKMGIPVTTELLSQLEKIYQIKLAVTVEPPGTLYDREELLSVGVVGKPQYIYTAADLAQKKYLKSVRV